MNWIAARMPNELARLARHWTRARAYIPPEWQKLFNVLLILAANRNLNPSGSSHSSVSTRKSSQHKVWGVCQTQAFSAFNSGKETLSCRGWKLGREWFFHSGHWRHLHVCSLFGAGDRYELDCCTNSIAIGETGKTLNWHLTILTGWHLHVYPFFSTGDRHELDCYTSFLSIGDRCVYILFQHGKTCSMLCSFFLPRWQEWHQQLRLFPTHPTQGLRCQLGSSFLGFQQWGGDTLLSRMETRKGMVLSQWSLATPACVLSVRCWWSIWTGLLHQLHSNWRDWQDIELAPHNFDWLTPACVPFLQYWWSTWTGLLHEFPINWRQVRIHTLPAWQNLFNALLILSA